MPTKNKYYLKERCYCHRKADITELIERLISIPVLTKVKIEIFVFENKDLIEVVEER